MTLAPAPHLAQDSASSMDAPEAIRLRLRLPAVVAAGVTSLLKPHRSRVTVVCDTEPDGVHVEVFDPVTHGAEAQRARMDGIPLLALVHARTREAETHARGFGACLILGLDVAGFELVRGLEEARWHAAGAGTEDGETPEADAALAELSPRELEVLSHIARGLSNHEIARELYLSVNSVKTYVRLAYRKVGVNSRPHAVIWGREHGLG